ncbi:hypothetical protein [Streptomyces sp. NPDC058701]|uniref:hypothetical protein n=1 Tax=Streptomyces sp. NPDC058701 TaxID=3346608 RepID=UPI0036592B22
MLAPTSRPCIQTAYSLYNGILERIEDADYEVLGRRVRVGLPTSLRVAGPAFAECRRLRRNLP